MDRRDFIRALGAAALTQKLRSQNTCPDAGRKADFKLEAGRVTVDLAPGKSVKTLGYNGSAPGPILRMKEGQAVTIDVVNKTDAVEIVHWHGLHIPSDVDGSTEEGTPAVAPGECRRYRFLPAPSGTRWYHTHVQAMRNLNRATYTGQFGFLYIEPKNDPGNYDQEVFLAFKEWDPYFSSMGQDEGIEVAYKRFSINGHALGHGDPIRVKQGQRIMLRMLNASATMQRGIAFAGHTFGVVAMDGNALPAVKAVSALELGPAERIDAIVEMNNPGIWILGARDAHDRQAGMAIAVEYADRTGAPVWLAASDERWDYTMFGASATRAEEAELVPLVFERKFVGRKWVDNWTINGKMFPKTDPIQVKEGRRYRLAFDNRSDEAHPVHLHRHTFELTKVAGVPTSGVFKDVVTVGPRSQVEVDFVANNPGPTLFHCHQQMHMDFGFMTMLQYL